MTRLIDTYGHKPACNDAGNPADCTCEVEAQAIMQQHVDALAERIDREGFEKFYKMWAAHAGVPTEFKVERIGPSRGDYDGIVTRGVGYRVVLEPGDRSQQDADERAIRTGRFVVEESPKT